MNRPDGTPIEIGNYLIYHCPADEYSREIDVLCKVIAVGLHHIDVQYKYETEITSCELTYLDYARFITEDEAMIWKLGE